MSLKCQACHPVRQRSNQSESATSRVGVHVWRVMTARKKCRCLLCQTPQMLASGSRGTGESWQPENASQSGGIFLHQLYCQQANLPATLAGQMHDCQQFVSQWCELVFKWSWVGKASMSKCHRCWVRRNLHWLVPCLGLQHDSERALLLPCFVRNRGDEDSSIDLGWLRSTACEKSKHGPRMQFVVPHLRAQLSQ